MDRTHNPEFTILEFYTAYKDYYWMMETTEQLLEKAAMDVCQTTEVPVGDPSTPLRAGVGSGVDALSTGAAGSASTDEAGG